MKSRNTENKDNLLRGALIVILAGPVLLYAALSFAWPVTPTYNTKSIEPLGQVGGEFTGAIDLYYETGGCDWKGLKRKFKSLWSVTFSTAIKDNVPHAVYYDPATEKVKVYVMATGVEVAATTDITKCYFTAKGQR